MRPDLLREKIEKQNSENNEEIISSLAYAFKDIFKAMPDLLMRWQVWVVPSNVALFDNPALELKIPHDNTWYRIDSSGMWPMLKQFNLVREKYSYTDKLILVNSFPEEIRSHIVNIGVYASLYNWANEFGNIDFANKGCWRSMKMKEVGADEKDIFLYCVIDKDNYLKALGEIVHNTAFMNKLTADLSTEIRKEAIESHLKDKKNIKLQAKI